MDYKRYKYSRNLAWEILIRERVRELPVKIIPLCQRMNIRVIRYSDAPLMADVSKDGCQAVIDGNMYILYDDKISSTRKRFTIAHELGHILMKHSGVPEDEAEANIFASRLLMPACILYECKVSSAEEIMQMCGVSRQAAEIRLSRLNMLKARNKFYLHPSERKVRRKFKKYIKGLRQNRGAVQALKSFRE